MYTCKIVWAGCSGSLLLLHVFSKFYFVSRSVCVFFPLLHILLVDMLLHLPFIIEWKYEQCIYSVSG